MYRDPLAHQLPASTAIVIGMVIGALAFVLGWL